MILTTNFDSLGPGAQLNSFLSLHVNCSTDQLAQKRVLKSGVFQEIT